jgi:alpha-glucoside transport system permease protein
MSRVAAPTGGAAAELAARDARAAERPTRRSLMAAAFLAPAAFFLLVWIVYPTVYTIWRSLYDRTGNRFVGLDNYRRVFSSDTIRTAIENNAIWVAVVPALITAIGLVFAVLTERIRWSVAFKTIVFMPMAISLFAAGVIWRLVYEQDPDRGALNAAVSVVHDAFHPSGVLAQARPSQPNVVVVRRDRGIDLRAPVKAGGTALLGLTAIPPREVPAGARQAATPAPAADAVVGTVWRDFKPGGGKAGAVEPGELGLPGVRVELRDTAGKKVGSATTGGDGSFRVAGLAPGGAYRASIAPSTFARPYGGVAWLSSRLITPAIMIAYIWVWAGFSMVVIAAGLSAIPRDVLEAARTDGAGEWYVFRRVTAPLLAPVLTVVFITMLINVLKVFDVVLAIAPASVQDDANVIALAMWRSAFGGLNDFGLGSAIAVFLFLLVIPVLALNVRRFKREA